MKHLITLLLFISLITEVRAQAPVPEVAMRLRILERIPFKLDGGKILLPVRQGKSIFHFGLDTGASLNSFDPAFLPDLGPVISTGKVELAGDQAGQGKPVNFYQAPEMFLGKLSLKNGNPVMVLDFQQLRQMGKSKMAGLIGMGFLKDYLVKIDFDEEVVEFCQPVDEKDQPLPHPLLPPLQAVESPSVVLTLPSGIKERFIFDTGDNGSGSLRAELFDELTAKGQIGDVRHDFPAATPGAFIKSSVGTVWPVLSFFGVNHHKVRLLRGYPSRIGMKVLSKHLLVFDFPRGKMYHSPRQDPALKAAPGPGLRTREDK